MATCECRTYASCCAVLTLTFISYREFKGWVKLILIRKVTDIAAVGISAKNEPERFEKAFKHIPRDDWFVFENPVDCNKIIRDTIAQDA